MIFLLGKSTSEIETRSLRTATSSGGLIISVLGQRFLLSLHDITFIQPTTKIGSKSSISTYKQLDMHQIQYFIGWHPTWQLTLVYRKCIHYTLLACVTYSFFWIHFKEQIIDKWTWIVWFHMWHVAKKSLIFKILNPSDTAYYFHYPYYR